MQRGLPIGLLVKYFMQVGRAWQIAPDLRSMVKFRRSNLLSDLATLGTFDVIRCRNVLIYFDQDTKIDMLHRLGEVLASDGYLILGAAETVIGLSDRFQIRSDKAGLYTVRPFAPRLLAQHGTTHARPRLIAIMAAAKRDLH